MRLLAHLHKSLATHFFGKIRRFVFFDRLPRCLLRTRTHAGLGNTAPSVKPETAFLGIFGTCLNLLTIGVPKHGPNTVPKLSLNFLPVKNKAAENRESLGEV